MRPDDSRWTYFSLRGSGPGVLLLTSRTIWQQQATARARGGRDALHAHDVQAVQEREAHLGETVDGHR
jgi:hypothetical protein